MRKTIRKSEVQNDVQVIKKYVKNSNWRHAKKIWKKYKETDVYQFIEWDLDHEKKYIAERDLELVIPIRKVVDFKTFLPGKHSKGERL